MPLVDDPNQPGQYVIAKRFKGGKPAIRYLVSLTQAEYDSIAVKDPETLYIIGDFP